MDLGAQKILQEGLEAEVDEFLGRDWYERSCGPKVYRNGYRPKTFKTRSGPLDVQLPRVRETEEAFESALLDRLDSIEQRLKSLAVEMYSC